MHEMRPCFLDMDGIFASGVVASYEDDIMRIEFASLAGAWDPGTRVRVEVLDDVRGECVYEATVAAREDIALDLRDLTRVATNQKRDAVRVDVHHVVDATVRPAGRTGETREVKVTLLDLSAYGMRLVASEPLSEGDTLTLSIPDVVDGPLGTRPLPVQAQVVRTQKIGGVPQHGCRLVGYDADRTDVLSRHVARVQREQLRKRAQYV